MARGILLKDQWYEVDKLNPDGSREVQAKMLIAMDKFNIGTAKDTINVSKNTQVAEIAAHVSMNLNEKEWGVHPRYLRCKLTLTPVEAKCNGIQPVRWVNIPVLTLEQFDKFKKFNKDITTAQPDTTIKINHSRDGSVKLEYKIMEKYDQVLI